MGVIAKGRGFVSRQRRALAGTTRRTIAEAAVVIAAVVIGIVIGASIERSRSVDTTQAPPAPAPAPAAPAPTQSSQSGVVAGASVGALRALSRGLGRPIYWDGPRPGFTYEVTLAPGSQRVCVRYLPPGIHIGSARPDFLAIGTYSVRNAAAALRVRARKPGGVGMNLPGGAVGFYSQARPDSVYIAYPGASEQIEVYDPSPGVALKAVKNGSVTPVG